MEPRTPNRRPADAILDRHMPDASAEEREKARESLRRLARFLLRVDDRHFREWCEQQIRASGGGEVDSESNLPPTV
jgi:hypothetical protein